MKHNKPTFKCFSADGGWWIHQRKRWGGWGWGGCLVWALILLLGFGKDLKRFSLISQFLFLVNPFSKQVSLQLTKWEACKQTNIMASCSLGNVGFQYFHSISRCNRVNDRLCHGYWAWLWLVRGLSTISIRNATAAGLITVTKRGSRWGNYVPVPQLKDKDLTLIFKFNVIVKFGAADSRPQYHWNTLIQLN